MFDSLTIFAVINCTYAYCVDVEVGDDDRLPFELNGVSGQKLERALKAWRYGVLSKMQTIGNQGEKKEEAGKKWVPRRSSRPHSPLRPRIESISSDLRTKEGDQLVVVQAATEGKKTEEEKQQLVAAAVPDKNTEYAMTAAVTSNPGIKTTTTAVPKKAASGDFRRCRQQVKVAGSQAACPVTGAPTNNQQAKRMVKQGKQQGQKQQPLVRSASWSPSQGDGMRMVHGSRSPELLATAAQAAKVAAIVKGGRHQGVSDEEKARREARRERAAAALRESHKWERGRWENGMGCGRLSILRKTTSV